MADRESHFHRSSRSGNSSDSALVGAILLILSLALPTQPAHSETPTADEMEFFEKKIRPLLAERCVSCHGPQKQWSNFRLDSRDALLKGGDLGTAVIPSKPEESPLLAAIKHEGELIMPPEPAPKLSEAEIGDLTHWIAIGAPWPTENAVAGKSKDPKGHWAFQPIQDPAIPDPEASHGLLTPVDAFVQAKLAENKLASSPPADRRTLIRRASIDLTGLLPSATEVDEFENDDDPQSYEKLIDRLLASPHYGEQWGRHWLDVARYSDSKGYVYAREERFWVHAWNYRDWVVNALNEDLPYDRFLLLQIAADQAATNPADKAAMGFLTIGRRFIGVSRDIIDDRIDVVSRGTMGLTVGCARCHDHKYDPIPTRDYYSLYGVFQNCSEHLVRLDDSPRDDAFEKRLREQQQKLDEKMAARRKEASDRIRSRLVDFMSSQLELSKYPEEGFDVVIEPSDIPAAQVRRLRDYLVYARDTKDPVFSAWHRFAEIPADQFVDKASAVCAELQKGTPEEVNPRVAAAFTTPPANMKDVAERYGRLLEEVNSEWGKQVADVTDQKAAPTSFENPADEALRKVLYGPVAPCEVPDEPMTNIEFFFTTSVCNELWGLQRNVDRFLIDSPESPKHTHLLIDRPTLVTPRVFKRGNPANLGDEVPRQFLEVIAGSDRKPFEKGSGRLELAESIIERSNPLTARVIVNRVWLNHFGLGLVRTPSDFGLRAETPSHPELLDWLATRFIEEDWSLKWLHRQIMLSAAYRQSEDGPVDPSVIARAKEIDPENRLLWRRTAHRLSFEEMRDAAFAAAGELDLSMSGKPIDLFNRSMHRRTLYGTVDRQYLPSTFRVFDFANPDLHIPQRSETTVPQQALFFLNHPMVLDNARSLARRLTLNEQTSPLDNVRQLYRAIYQRDPAHEEAEAALALINSPASLPEEDAFPPTANDWSYGYGEFDEKEEKVSSFHPLPYFTGKSWQGGSNMPDGVLGWVELNAKGGHAGNDLAHAAIRRWTAPKNMRVRLKSTLSHPSPEGDGIHGVIYSSRQGFLGSSIVHNSPGWSQVTEIDVQAGDTIDFIVDRREQLNHDEFEWKIVIKDVRESTDAIAWNAETDFRGIRSDRLTPWEQLAQVLLASNEFLFVD